MEPFTGALLLSRKDRLTSSWVSWCTDAHAYLELVIEHTAAKRNKYRITRRFGDGMLWVGGTRQQGEGRDGDYEAIAIAIVAAPMVMPLL